MKDKETLYKELIPQAESLLEGETDEIACMANLAALLHRAFGVSRRMSHRGGAQAGFVGEDAAGRSKGLWPVSISHTGGESAARPGSGTRQW